MVHQFIPMIVVGEKKNLFIYVASTQSMNIKDKKTHFVCICG